MGFALFWGRGGNMEHILGLTVGMTLLALYFIVFSFRAEREINRLKKRTRYLNERLEAVEKFNGLGMTNTDINIRM
jgi:hypothetical protein